MVTAATVVNYHGKAILTVVVRVLAFGNRIVANCTSGAAVEGLPWWLFKRDKKLDF